MALVVKHEFVSGVADGADATQVQPSHWNAAHTLSGSAAIAQVDGLQAELDAKVSSKIVLLGEISLGAAIQSIRFSGSWTNVARFSLDLTVKTTAISAGGSFSIYSDGGTTPFLSTSSLTISTAYAAINLEIFDSGAFKSMRGTKYTGAIAPAGIHTATDNAEVINCIQFVSGASATLSAGIAQLWGYYR